MPRCAEPRSGRVTFPVPIDAGRLESFPPTSWSSHDIAWCPCVRLIESFQNGRCFTYCTQKQFAPYWMNEELEHARYSRSIPCRRADDGGYGCREGRAREGRH